MANYTNKPDFELTDEDIENLKKKQLQYPSLNRRSSDSMPEDAFPRINSKFFQKEIPPASTGAGSVDSGSSDKTSDSEDFSNTLQTVVSNNAKKIAPEMAGETESNLQSGYETPDDSEVKSATDRIDALIASYKPSDPSDVSNFSEAEEEAKRLYQEKASRNEWLSLADKIGQSLVRLNAANQGLARGVDMSHVDLGQGIDWDKQTDRDFKEYESELKRQDNLERRQLYQDKLKGTLSEDQFKRNLMGLNYKLKAAENKLDKEYDDLKSRRSNDERASEHRASLGQAERHHKENLDLRRELDYGKDTRQQNALDTKAGLVGAKISAQQDIAAHGAASAASLMETGSKDQRKQAERDLSKYAAQLGTSPQAVIDMYHANLEKPENRKPGIVYGTNANETAAVNGTVSNLMQALQQTPSRGGATPAASTPSRAAAPGGDGSQGSVPPPSGDKVIVRDRNGKKYRLPKDQLQDAISQGFTEVK
jgi:hypothetical protein